MSGVRSNIFWLMLVQCSGYIFPVIMLPYLVRTLGVDNFGVYSIILAIIQYGVMLTEFGFNFSSTRDIALHKKEKKIISKVFFLTIYSKLLLFSSFLILIITYLVYFNMLREYLDILIAGSLTIFVNIFYPIWFFQGIEKVKFISIVTAISRSFTLLLTFFFVKHSDDLIPAIYVNSLLYAFPAILGCIMIFMSKSIVYVRVDLKEIFICLKRSFPLFLSNVSISLYSTLNTIVLGKYSTADVVGNFAAADKLRLAIQGLYAPVQQAVFPRASKIVNTEQNGIRKVIFNFGFPFIFFGIIISVCYLLFGKFAVSLYYGEKFVTAGIFFQMMYPLPIIISVATVFTHWVLIALGKNKTIAKVYIFFSLVHIAYVIPFVKAYSAQGMIYSVILTQTLITLTMMISVFLYLKRIVK